MRERVDVVVIGGGIVGAAAAYFLAKRGVSVTLVEKGRVAFEQSSRNWGWVRQNGRNLREVPAAIVSRRIWAGLRGEIGTDVGWVSAGNVDLAYSAEEMRTFEAWRRGAAELGLDTEVLSREAVRDRLPWLKDGYVGGIFSPLDGQADPHRAAPALARAAQEQGAEVVTDCIVEALDVDDGAVRGVRTERGTIAAGRVIVAAGAWSSRLLWPLGLRLPQRKVRATVLATTPAPALSPVVVWTDDVAMRQGPDGRFILAGGGRSHYDVDLELARFAPRFARSLFDARRRGRIRLHLGRTALRDLRTLLPEPVGEPLWPQVRAEEPEPDVDAAWRTFRRFRELVPQAADVGVDRIWAGYIDYTPDAVPIIDAPGTPRGLVIATGFSGHGFALGPVGGLLASQLATDEPTAVDVRSFRLSRFDEGDTAEDVLHF